MLGFFPLYFSWHYGRALAEFGGVWGNLMWFVGHFFSLPTMFRTLFSPWRRLSERYPRALVDLGAFGEALVVNILMRIVGFVARIVIIVVATICYMLLVALGILAFLVWLTLPLLVPVLVLGSVIYLF